MTCCLSRGQDEGTRPRCDPDPAWPAARVCSHSSSCTAVHTLPLPSGSLGNPFLSLPFSFLGERAQAHLGMSLREVSQSQRAGAGQAVGSPASCARQGGLVSHSGQQGRGRPRVGPTGPGCWERGLTPGPCPSPLLWLLGQALPRQPGARSPCQASAPHDDPHM